MMKNRNFTNFNEFLNIRYIRRVESIYMNPSDFDYMIERFKKISEENDKLKAEKEELELENVCANHVIDKLKAEIEQLKAELEQSVKLPCKIGDTVYILRKDISEINTGKIMEICISSEITQIVVYLKEDNRNVYIDIVGFGIIVFTSQEEAEQVLKGKVEE